MPRFEIDVDPCDHITADAIGKPGQRVFYIQAFQDQRTITVIIEKAQLNSMAIGIEQFLSQLDEQNPDLSEASGDYVEEVMRINPPVDPLFSVGEIGRGYDKDRDMVVLFVKDVAELRRLGAPAIRASRANGLLWVTYPKGGQTKGATDLPATPWWMQRDVLGEITLEVGYKPVAFVAIDDSWTALRFKRV